MNYARHAFFGSGFTLIALILGNGFAYLFRMFLAKNLSLEEYGLFYAVFNFILLFLFFRDMGLNTALTKFIPEYAAKKRWAHLKSMMGAILLIQMVTSFMLCAVLYLASETLATGYFRSPLAETMIQFLLIYIILSVGLRFIRGCLIGFKKFFIGSFIEPANNFLVFAFAVLFIALGKGVLAPVFAYLLSMAILIITTLPLLIRRFNPFKVKMEGFPQELKSVFFFGIPMMLAALGGQIIGYMDTVMLTFFSDLSTVGIYNVILPSALLFVIFGRVITTVMVPFISELHANNDSRRISKGIEIIYKYVIVLAAPFILAVFAFPGFFLLLFFGPEYVPGALAFQILLIGVLFYLLSQVNEAILIGLGRPMTITWITLIAASLNIVLNLILIPLIGMIGAAIATALSYILMLTLTTINVRNLFSFSSPLRYWALTALSGIAFLAVTSSIKNALFINKWLEISVSLTAGMIAYAGIALMTRLIDTKELQEYRKMILRRPGR